MGSRKGSRKKRVPDAKVDEVDRIVSEWYSQVRKFMDQSGIKMDRMDMYGIYDGRCDLDFIWGTMRNNRHIMVKELDTLLKDMERRYVIRIEKALSRKDIVE